VMHSAVEAAGTGLSAYVAVSREGKLKRNLIVVQKKQLGACDEDHKLVARYALLISPPAALRPLTLRRSDAQTCQTH